MTTGEKNTGARSSIWHFIFITLLFAVGIEMLRLFMSSLLFYMREAREVSTVGVGGVAFLCFLMVFLAPVLARGMGARGCPTIERRGTMGSSNHHPVRRRSHRRLRFVNCGCGPVFVGYPGQRVPRIERQEN